MPRHTNNQNDLYSMERSHKSIHEDNYLNDRNLNMTQSSEKKVRFDDSFISNFSQKENRHD